MKTKILAILISLVLLLSMVNVAYSESNIQVTIYIDFVGNLLFSKYDVDLYIDNTFIAEMAHGKDYNGIWNLTPGTHTLHFYKTGDKTVKGACDFTATEDADFSCNISASSGEVNVSKIKLTPQKTATPKPTSTPTPKKTATHTPQKTATPPPKLTSTPTPKTTATPKPTASYTVPPSIAAATYKEGDDSNLILQIKQKMQQLGYFKENADLSGKYNSTMVERIKQFQKNNGLSQTGIIDNAFLSALYGPLAVKNDTSSTGSASASTNTTKSSTSSNTSTSKSSSSSSQNKSSSSSSSQSKSSTSSSSSSKSSTKKSNSSGSSNTDAPYIANRNTGVFHHSWCSSVKQMNESNKVGFNSSSAAKNAGYRACKRCKP